MSKKKNKKKAATMQRLSAAVLGELDYLRLVQARARVNEAVIQGNAEIEQATGLSKQRIEGASRALSAAFAKVAPKYGLDPKKDYSFDDANRRIVEVKR